MNTPQAQVVQATIVTKSDVALLHDFKEKYRAAGCCAMCALGFALSELESRNSRKFDHGRPPLCKGKRFEGPTCRSIAIRVRATSSTKEGQA